MKRKGVSHYVGSALAAGFFSCFPAHFAYTLVPEDEPVDHVVVGVWMLFTVPGTLLIAAKTEPRD